MRTCHHCKQPIEAGDGHDCWTTTEDALTRDLPEDLKDAWERLRETAVSFGEQRIYASGTCIMFARKTCYFFFRPRRSCLEVSVFLGRALKARQVHRAERRSKTKVANILRITHRDEVEAPVTDWLLEAYDAVSAAPPRTPRSARQLIPAGHSSASSRAARRSRGPSGSRRGRR